MFTRAGVPTSRAYVEQYMQMANEFSNQLIANPTLRLDWEVPHYINEDGEIVPGPNQIAVIRLHIGKHSIEGSGVFKIDLIDVSVSPTGGCGFLNWAITKTRENHAIIEHHAENGDDAITISSTIHYEMSNLAFSGSVLFNRNVSRFLPVNTALVNSTMPVLASLKIGNIPQSAYAEHFKSGLINKQTVPVILKSVLGLTDPQAIACGNQVNELVNDGLNIYDNTYIYFKLFCNVFARARLELSEMVPLLPDINN